MLWGVYWMCFMVYIHEKQMIDHTTGALVGETSGSLVVFETKHTIKVLEQKTYWIFGWIIGWCSCGI